MRRRPGRSRERRRGSRTSSGSSVGLPFSARVLGRTRHTRITYGRFSRALADVVVRCGPRMACGRVARVRSRRAGALAAGPRTSPSLRSASGAGSSESRADAMCALLAPSLRASEPFGSRDERPRRHHGRVGGMLFAPLLGLLALAVSALAAPADQITPKTFAVPERTAWRPLDCRSVPGTDRVLLPRTGRGAVAPPRLPPRARRSGGQQRGRSRLRPGLRTGVGGGAGTLPSDDARLRQRGRPLHDAAAAARADPDGFPRPRHGGASL